VLRTEQVANPRLNLKTLSVIFPVVASFVLIDVVVSSLVDVYRDFTTSAAGISLYLAVTGVLVAGTYIILKMTGDKIRGQSRKGTYENRLAIGCMGNLLSNDCNHGFYHFAVTFLFRILYWFAFNSSNH
jgi:hypothetical protein